MKRQFGKSAVTATRVCALLAAAATPMAADADDDDPPQFSDWSAPVNLGPPVNSAFAEQFPAISKNGLSLYFACFNCPGNLGGADIWVSQRASVDAPWGTPQNLGPNVNSSASDSGPALSPDGHQLYFNSNRAVEGGGFGVADLYVSRRHKKRDDFGWQPAESLGSGVNTSFGEGFPEVFEDDDTGTVTLYFQSNRLGQQDIYASTLQADETFGPPVLVAELSSPFDDLAPAIRRDGLEMFLASDRSGTLGNIDLWVSTRASTSDPWSTPVNLGPVVNGEFADAAPALSRKGTELYFQLPNHPGNVGGPQFDIWVTTRTKLKEPDDD